MNTRPAPRNRAAEAGPSAAHWLADLPAVLLLAAMAAWCLATSWRKWPDPIADAGTQWFVFWRLAHGAVLYHDVIWNYGPLSAWFDAGLFQRFGPGMMVLVAANLAVYAGIVALAYVAFRKAWGRPGAFAALMVFICVFSFSRLNAIGNYNYATPYANESTHGMLLLLVTAFAAVWWCRGPSPPIAFFLGVCGGFAAVLKPEFMLAGGLMGVCAVIVRWLQHQRASVVEFMLIGAGLVLPTLVFTLWFVGGESLGAAFVDASGAWWPLLFNHARAPLAEQHMFLGLDQPWTFALREAMATGRVLLAIAVIWAAGWMANRPWKLTIRAVLILAAGVLVYYLRPPEPATANGWANGWLYIGSCLPGMAALIFIYVILQAARQLRQTGRVEEGTMMAMALTLSAGAMLLRMPLLARIDHLGFYQAALAGMVTAAFMVADVPRWTGAAWGRRIAATGSLASLAIGCVLIAKMSYTIRTGQTVPVGEGRDRFYCDAPDIDETGSLIEWTVEYLRTVPPAATVCVLPEGAMVNYLSRRTNPVVAARSEPEGVSMMRRMPPDYVIFVPRNLAERHITHYGAPGQPGFVLMQWLRKNYVITAGQGGDPLDAQSPHKGVLVLRHDPKAAAQALAPKPAP